MEFLTSLDICCPVVPGACLLPSVLPKIPPPGTCLELRAAQVANDMDSLSGFLPSMHPVMIWGVDQVWSMEQSTSGITATQLMEFLTSLDICCPVVPGACLLPSVLPKIPPPGTCLELNNMVPKRVYLLGYLPSFFPAHLTCRILQALANCNILSRGTPLYPQSPSSPSPRAEVPIITPSGAVLYLWKITSFSRTRITLSCS